MHPTYKRMLEGLQKKAANAPRSSPREKWFLYILKCCDGSFYTGITNDLERRFKMHQTGKASRYTRVHRPVEMVYQEKCGNRSKALIRECEVKEWPKKKKVALVTGELKKKKPRKKKEKLILKTGPRDTGHGPRKS